MRTASTAVPGRRRSGPRPPAARRVTSRRPRPQCLRHWRIRKSLVFVPLRVLPDGSYRQCQRIKKPAKNTVEVRKRDEPRTPSNVRYTLKVNKTPPDLHRRADSPALQLRGTFRSPGHPSDG